MGQLHTDLVWGCPDGYSEDSVTDTCATQQKQAQKALCPSGYQVRNGQICELRAEEKSGLLCPGGYTLHDGLCGRMEVTARKIACPAGWVIDGATKLCKCPLGVCVNAGSPYLASSVADGTVTPAVIPSGAVVPSGGSLSPSQSAQSMFDIVEQAPNTLASNVEVRTVVIPAPAPRTIYYPQYVVLPADGSGGSPRVITPASPQSPAYNPTGLEGTYVTAPSVPGGNLAYYSGV